jgi:hypothetical protein
MHKQKRHNKKLKKKEKKKRKKKREALFNREPTTCFLNVSSISILKHKIKTIKVVKSSETPLPNQPH